MRRLYRALDWTGSWAWAALVGLFLGLSVNSTEDGALVVGAALIMIGRYLEIVQQRDRARALQMEMVATAAETFSQSVRQVNELKDLLVAEKQHSLHLQTRCIALSSQIHNLIRPPEVP